MVHYSEDPLFQRSAILTVYTISLTLLTPDLLTLTLNLTLLTINLTLLTLILTLTLNFGTVDLQNTVVGQYWRQTAHIKRPMLHPLGVWCWMQKG